MKRFKKQKRGGCGVVFVEKKKRGKDLKTKKTKKTKTKRATHTTHINKNKIKPVFLSSYEYIFNPFSSLC